MLLSVKKVNISKNFFVLPKGLEPLTHRVKVCCAYPVAPRELYRNTMTGLIYYL